MESNDKLEQLLKQMYAKEAFHEEDIDTSDIVDEEWAKFEAEYFGNEKEEVKSGKFSLLKIAALFIGVLMLSGISYAAIQLIGNRVDGVHESPTQESQMTTPRQQTGAQEILADSTQVDPVVFEDAELKTILSEIATFYQIEPVYKKEAAKHVRLYFTWDKKQTIDDIIETFNKFERFHITRENQELIVE